MTVIFALYSYLLLPLLILIAKVAALFSPKIRRALLARNETLDRINSWYKNENSASDIIMIHASSMGEFEHIKPLIVRLQERYDIRILVTFFSPSAFESVQSFEGVSLFSYIPVDTMKNWRLLFDQLKPKALFISKHDVWPNQIRCAGEYNIPSFLINASLSRKSGRTSFPARLILKNVYNSLTEILTISQEDSQRFQSTLGCERIMVVGDTKFDQVVIRKENALKTNRIPREWTEDKTVIILGSIWPEDAVHVLPVVSRLMQKRKDLHLIIVPHQPSLKFLERIQKQFEDQTLCFFTAISDLKDQRIIVVDIVGVLADLYRYGQIAYVGGSFRQGIHNVMEPAVYQIPVLHGPVHKNSFEAIQLHRSGGSLVCKNELEFEMAIKKLLADKEYCLRIGKIAGSYAEQNTGATDRILQRLDAYLN